MKILDLETKCECARNERGEIWVKCRGIVPGYFDAEEDFNVDGDGFFRTGVFHQQHICLGDLGWLDEDNRLHVADRVKDTFMWGRNWVGRLRMPTNFGPCLTVKGRSGTHGT